jgi:hypothetical protein
MFNQPSIEDYYRGAIRHLQERVNNTSDNDALAFDNSTWAADLIRKYGMEPVEIDQSRETCLRELSETPGSNLLLVVPVVPSDTLQVISKDKLRGQTFSVGYDVSEIHYDHDQGILSFKTAPDPQSVERAKRIINEQIGRWNETIEHCNVQFPRQVAEIIEAKKKSVAGKHKNLDLLAEKVGIPLRKRSDIREVVPTAIKVRTKISPLIAPAAKREQQLVLEHDKFNAIVELIENQCRQFERTPTVFSKLHEEDLRDILLSSLNAIFEGAAVGEAFQGIGKVDIHLRISKGEVFIAECKFWSGPSTITEVTAQLLERLTWRDSFGVAIIFSLNAEFGRVIEAIPDTIQRNSSGSCQKHGEHHFSALFTLPNDRTKKVEIHYLAYNLFLPRPSKRSAKS